MQGMAVVAMPRPRLSIVSEIRSIALIERSWGMIYGAFGLL
jgi:hypothetical protein